MTKRELIEMLKDYDENTMVVFCEDDIDPRSGHYFGLSLSNLEVRAEDNVDKKYFRIRQKRG